MSVKKEEICFIRAKMKQDYVFDGIRDMGYQILIPYIDYNLIFRCAREVWFRLRLPGKSFWYNKKIRKKKAKCFIIKDPLITPGFLEWVRKCHPGAKIILEYDNRADMTICPNCVHSSIEKWSYDLDDCKKYNMKKKPSNYLDIYRIERLDSPEYDVLYLGRDKGRAEMLLELQREFEGYGCKTYFHICADRRFFQKKKSFYKPLLTYQEYLQLLKRSKSILNIMPEGQTSITQRELECVFDGVKCFTNNKGIRNFSLYHPSRFFVLGEDSMSSVSDFLRTDYLPVPEAELASLTYQNAIESMVNDRPYLDVENA